MLAGPVVRRVELRRCSFWVALSQEATVKALIWQGDRSGPIDDSVDPPKATGELKTRKIGESLHVAVVTVDLTSVQPLVAGALYSYDLRFTFANATRSDLRGEGLLKVETVGTRMAGVDAMAPLHLPLGFENDKLPTFLAPPATFAGTATADGLRIAHCSCRRAGGGSFDALAGLAPVVEGLAPLVVGRPERDKRPHQLFMTGDQVYADDISLPLLPVVMSLAADVMGASQKLPGFPPDPRTGATGSGVTGAGLPGDRANLPPLRRKWLLWQLAGFTGGDAENHAITFGEFAALHLLAWSPRVWRAIPAFADVVKAPRGAGGAPAPAAAIEPWLNRPWFCSAKNPAEPDEEKLKREWETPGPDERRFTGFNRATHHLARYAGVTPRVAQVLANTPTYMIFDDHEIADDWNLNGRWATKVYNRGWGRYVVRNGLMAYTLMQAWGNDPAHFSADKPGKKLLDAIPAAIAGTSPTADVDVLLGFDRPTTAQPKRVAFHYALENESYKIAVLDTRTHRAINNSSLAPPNLIDNLDEQLPARSATATQRLLIVVSAVPVFSPVVIEQIGQPLAQLAIDYKARHEIGQIPGFAPDETDPRLKAGCGTLGQRGGERFDREGWSANEAGFEALVARLATYESVVVLSGDVHYASTTTLDYWTKEGKQARLVQCISSPAKNVFKDVVDQVVRKIGNLQQAAEVPMERLAWKEPVDPALLIKPGARLSIARRSRLRRKPALVPTSPWPAGSALPANAAKGPDWRWRIQTVADLTTQQADLPAGLRADQIVEADVHNKPLGEQLVAISIVHQRRLLANRPMLRRLVFAPNFGTVRFEPQTAGAIDIVHRLHTPESAEPFATTEHAPRPAGRPADPQMGFGPHTVHRAPLRTSATEAPPKLIAATAPRG